MTAPYVPSPEHTEVLVTVDGQQWPGLVIGWRGDRVDVTWQTGIGETHVGFVEASQVKRVAGWSEAPGDSASARFSR